MKYSSVLFIKCTNEGSIFVSRMPNKHGHSVFKLLTEVELALFYKMYFIFDLINAAASTYIWMLNTPLNHSPIWV